MSVTRFDLPTKGSEHVSIQVYPSGGVLLSVGSYADIDDYATGEVLLDHEQAYELARLLTMAPTEAKIVTQSVTPVAPDSDDPKNVGSKPESVRNQSFRQPEADAKGSFF